jgi:dipeptidyl aminopeptidase/acylaminoacyl peptidase
MMKAFASLLTIVFAVSAPVSAQTPVKRAITHDDVFTMKRTSAPRPSPDGKWIVYTVTEPNYDPALTVSDLWLVPSDGSAPPRRLTSTRRGESGVAWARDSQRIAFSTRREGDDADQVYVLSLSGGDAQRVTSIATGATNPQWRPDDAAILVESVARDAAPDKSTARAFDTMPIRFWNTWMDGSKPRLFIQPLNGGAATDVLGGTRLAASSAFDAPFVGDGSDRSLQAQWSRDGQEIVFVAYVNLRVMMTEDTESHLFRMKPGSEPVPFTATGESFEHPVFSPDGKTLLARHMRASRPGQLYSLVRLARFDWPAGTERLLTDGFDRSVGDFDVAPDGRTVVFNAEDNGFTSLFRVPLAGGMVTKLFEMQEGAYGSPVYAGSRLFAMFGSSTQPAELARVIEERGTHALVTDSNRARLSQLDLPKPEHFWFTASNGKRIHSIIFFPPQLDRTKRYPLIVNPHGGPNSMSGDTFSTRWNYHLLTAPGYVLLATNYTGSTGFGEKFAEDIERDVLRGPAKEILEAADEAIRRYSFIDRTRQAAVGASYGGYLMNWFNGHTDQFRTLVIHAGASNNESQYGVNDGGMGRELRMGAPIWETGKGQWMDQSPFRYADKWKTPALITQGEQDFRVPINESITTFKLLQRNKVPARLLVFPDEGHWILKGENSRRHMQEVLGWLAKYLQPSATTTTASASLVN